MDSKFKFELKITKDNISTFLQPGWRLITIPKKSWEGLISLTGDAKAKLKFSVSQSLINEKSGALKTILERIQDECSESELELQYKYNEQTLKCKFPPRAFGEIISLFVASGINYKSLLVSSGEGKKLVKKQFRNPIEWFDEHNESFTLEIDVNEKSAQIVSLDLYENSQTEIFLEYARNAMLSTSYSRVLGIDVPEAKVRDFYSDIHEWVPVDRLKDIKNGDVRNVIYMLYDENNQTFYVGRADDLKDRLTQHQKKYDDPIPDFTHFRYSIIDEQYIEYSYIIEDAAIHDCAALLEMTNRKNIKKSLQQCIIDKKINGNMTMIKMVNTAESQPHLRNKK